MMEPDEVYSAILFFPNPEHKSIEMIMNSPNFINLDINQKYGGGGVLTLKEKMHMLFPGDILLFNQKKELVRIVPRRVKILKKKHVKH